jgi:hypothetical protein
MATRHKSSGYLTDLEATVATKLFNLVKDEEERAWQGV